MSDWHLHCRDGRTLNRTNAARHNDRGVFEKFGAKEVLFYALWRRQRSWLDAGHQIVGRNADSGVTGKADIDA